MVAGVASEMADTHGSGWLLTGMTAVTQQCAVAALILVCHTPPRLVGLAGARHPPVRWGHCPGSHSQKWGKWDSGPGRLLNRLLSKLKRIGQRAPGHTVLTEWSRLGTSPWKAWRHWSPWGRCGVEGRPWPVLPCWPPWRRPVVSWGFCFNIYIFLERNETELISTGSLPKLL